MSSTRDTSGGAAPATAAPRRRPGRLPVLLLVPAGLGLAFLVLPLVGLLIRAPWSHACPSG